MIRVSSEEGKAAKKVKISLLIVSEGSNSGSSYKGAKSEAFRSMGSRRKFWIVFPNKGTYFDLSLKVMFYFTLPLS